MNRNNFYRYLWIAPAFIIALVISGCANNFIIVPTVTPTSTSADIQPTAETAAATPEATPGPTPVVDSNVLYHDTFTDPTTGWPEAKFDNYFIGYHEPENYHVEIASPNYKTTVFEPGKKAFGDATIEAKTFAVSSKTAETGDFSFGVVFRRSGDQYYAFAISQRTKKWYVLKSTPNALTILAQGTDDAIQNLDTADVLRVDMQGSNFTLSIDGQPVKQVSDADYATGEVGFFVQTFDAAKAHVHFDELTIRKFEATPIQALLDTGSLYHDDFTNATSGWPEAKFDNYFIGYHEPEFYHVEVASPNYKTTVFEPEKKEFGDATIKVKAFAVSSKTAETGDFSFGVVFRRSGDQYYAFAISQRTKKWYVLKSAPNALTILAQGTDDAIQNLDAADVLRVDMQGSNFALSIDDKPVGQFTDADYASGEVGFFVQTFDAPNAHIHFDDLAVLPFEGTPAQVLPPGTLFHDDFTNPASGWPEAKFDNYLIGYHEPEFYEVEVDSPNFKATTFEPEKKEFGDVTIEAKAFAASSKTSESGDFSFGIAFRRSGDQYYAFAISQRTKKWYVLKSAPSSRTILAEGTSDSIHDMDVPDVLRVDAHQSHFFLSINDQLVTEVVDADYATGDVGLFVQTFDAAKAHIHFDELNILKFEASLMCEVQALFLNVRSGPDINKPSIGYLSRGDMVDPLGLSADKNWLMIAMEDGSHSWVFNSREFLTCNSAVDMLPVMSPEATSMPEMTSMPNMTNP